MAVSSDKMQHKKYRRHISSAVAFMIIALITSCLKTTRPQFTYEPIYTMLLDDSRIENDKVRHVFREIFLKELVRGSAGSIIIYDGNAANQTCDRAGEKVKYMIAFDIMDYMGCSAEGEPEKLLAAAKIIEKEIGIVRNSFVESTRGADLQRVCELAGSQLAKPVIRHLLSLRNISLLPDSIIAQDSAQIKN